MRRRSLIAFILLVGCASTLSAPVTSPVLDVSARRLPSLPTKSVLVVSAATFQQIAADLTFNPCLSSTAAEARAGGTGCPAAPVAELEAITTLAERAFFEAGWEPVTQAAAAKLITSAPVATGLRAVLARGQASLLEGSMLVGLASSADLFLVVSDWRTHFSGPPVAETGGAKLCPLAGTLGVEAYGRAGQLLWRGHVTVQTTDTTPVSVTGEEVSPQGFACAARQSCAECTTGRAVAPPAVQELLTRATGALMTELLANHQH
jgi:hypothetical protein